MQKGVKSSFHSGLTTSIPEAAPKGLSVDSDLVTFENRRGMRIVGFHDFPKGNHGGRRWMIVLPGYGETKIDVLTVSYSLAKHGFHTLRFDYSDHVGESDGEILYTTLTKMKEDILSSVDYLYRRFQPSAVGVVGSSLASRALLRAAREDDRIDSLVNLVSVVDLRKTLFSIYHEDHVERALKGLNNGIMDVLGFQIDADHFLQSVIQDHYESLLSTIEDVAHIKAPIVFFAAEKDVWVELEDVRRVFDASHSIKKNLFVLKGAMHRLYENPRVVNQVVKDLTECSLRYLPDCRRSMVVSGPDLREIGARIRKEKERSRIFHTVTKEEEREFWRGYLQKYSFAINVHDYWNLLDFVDRLLGGRRSREKILDAGCGIGNYGTFLLVKLMYRLRQSPIVTDLLPFFSYVGVDFVKEALQQAEHTHRRLENEFAHGLKERPAHFSYFLADLETGMPFEADIFDKLCCNLVLSYLQNPGTALKEMVRVLKSGGRIVVASLKPFADLSEVYRNFIRVADTPLQIEEARKLLSNAGRVKAKEAEGIYSFFSEEELTDLLKEAGIVEIETYRSFGNQANVAVGLKV